MINITRLIFIVSVFSSGLTAGWNLENTPSTDSIPDGPITLNDRLTIVSDHSGRPDALHCVDQKKIAYMYGPWETVDIICREGEIIIYQQATAPERLTRCRKITIPTDSAHVTLGHIEPAREIKERMKFK